MFLYMKDKEKMKDMAMTFMSKKSGMDRSAVILGMDRTAFVRAL